MAVDTLPLRLRKSTILAKIEATTGTVETLAAADGAFNAFNHKFTPALEGDDRPKQGGFGQLAKAPGTRSGTLEFDVDLVGLGASGAVPGWATTLLATSGMTNTSGTWSFGSPVAEVTASLGFMHEGRAHYLVGAQADMTINLVAGHRGLVHFRYLGKMGVTADAALPAPTYPTAIPPQWKNGCTLHSVVSRPATAAISINNELKLREDPNDDTGFRSCAIVDRRPVLSMDPESVLVATKNWLSIYGLGTTSTLSLVLGATANNIITIASTAAQVTNFDQTDRGKILTDQLEFLSLNDDLTIAFT